MWIFTAKVDIFNADSQRVYKYSEVGAVFYLEEIIPYTEKSVLDSNGSQNDNAPFVKFLTTSKIVVRLQPGGFQQRISNVSIIKNAVMKSQSFPLHFKLFFIRNILLVYS